MRERHLRWDTCYNARDLGGHTTDDGATTRWGVLVRADSVGRLNTQGRAALEAYGVRTIIDLRLPVEVRDEPSPFMEHDAITTHALPLDPNDRLVSKAVVVHKETGLSYTAAMNAAYLSTHQLQIAAIIRAVADASEGGIVIHCHAGRDRTGLIVALLLGIAGVPAATISADYALSFSALSETMDATLSHIETTYGGIAPYLHTTGLTDDEIARIHHRLRADEDPVAS
ncbi:MAG: tyrosine-protein phosphatase [Thermomicrobia bacterium]|nr:tyrosine-protein phosphatase [Thermomicrobia bacterium]